MVNESYPLAWPVGRERTQPADRKWGGFKTTASRVREQLSTEMRRMKVDEYIISSNVATRRDGLPYAGQKAPEDPGVVLYFNRKGHDIAISCDHYVHVDSNLRAIGLSIEAIRGMERWGTEEMVDRAFTGFAALPESVIVTPYTARAWWEVLEVSSNASREMIDAAYRVHAKKTHPDSGGSQAAFEEVNRAYKEARS